MSELKDRIIKILDSLNENIHERDEVISVAFLSALADQNIFLFGPPGTAKSLISRRLAKVFQNENYFEYLMQKFSTPEEVFGPVSLTELKKDNYVRKTDGYLPNAEFAFLDEIWKSSPAILNTLLTIINEKKFRNGSEVKNVPLKVLVSASNETPPSGQGLEALYDRFLTRLYVPPMENKQNFESLLQSSSTTSEINISEDLIIKNTEWEEWKKKIETVKLSKETLNVIHDIRLQFEAKGKSLDIYVSDRRWQKASMLLKAAAFFCDRSETNLVDTLLLRHCLWTTNENREEIIKIVEEAVRKSGFETGMSLQNLDKEKEALEKEIEKEVFHSSDIYETVKLNGNKQYFKCTEEYSTGYNYNRRQEKVTFYIPYTEMKGTNEFNPVDAQGNTLKWMRCSFDKQGTCNIKYNEEGKEDSYYLDDNDYWKYWYTYQPKILFHKGDKKDEVNERLIESLKLAVIELKDKIEKFLQQIDSKLVMFQKEIDTPFVKKEFQKIALESILSQQEDMRLRLKDCERLESLVG
ncbi:AAA family ATPase [Aliarcobacter skirrowii]|uniref:AAA family ATPase n=1 Tax=Aliarcobacter skirrowii TaxID=28200 RepID=UPI0029B71E86|nr:AAA family ATPase [Aliarcobacter skirrowii]MDX4071641.1 AAA family ATPase [Aliarcobacter skirrowii]